MRRFIVRRVALSLVTLWLIATMVFVIVSVLPDDPGRRIAGPFAPQETVDFYNDQLGVNDPLAVQYGNLMKSIVTFDFGDSIRFGEPVSSLIGPALGRSAKLVTLGLLITLPLSILGGIVAARKKDTVTDRSIVTLGLASSSIPEFVSGVTLQFILGIQLGILPVLATAPRGSGFFTEVKHLLLPAIALSIVYFGYIARMTRAGTIMALDADYTRTARMKGLNESSVMTRHVMRNALQPTVSVVAIQIGYLFSGLIGLELIFNYNGLGSLILDASSDKDFPLLQAGVIVVGIIYMVTTLMADLVIAWMNPRARLAGGG